jgi:excisionase family DNA binding protein
LYEGARLEQLLTLEEVAETLRVSTDTVRRLTAEGAIPWVRVGHRRGSIRVWPSDVACYLERQREEGERAD